jgi:predicted ferric reductase
MSDASGPRSATTKGLTGRGLAAVYLVVVLVPVLATAAGGSISFGAALVTLAGIAALAMMLAQFVTSGRFEWVAGRIGLDVTMGFHRITGVAVLAMVILHVLAVPFRLGIPAPDRFLSRLQSAVFAPGNTTGVLAFVILALIVVWAISGRGRRLPYVVWRVVHGFGAVVAVGLATQHAIARGDALSAGPVAVWFAVLWAIALSAMAIVYLLRPRTARAPGFRVTEARRLSPSVVELVVETATRGAFAFRPGQFAWIAFGGRHTVSDNPFSIASAPEELPRMRFLIREVGDCSRAILGLAPGTPVAVDGPHGGFVERGDADAVILVAGGIGIAPMLSILRASAARGDRRRFRLALAVRHVEDLSAAPDLDELAKRLDLTIEYFVEEGDPGPGMTRGRIGATGCARLVEGLDPARTTAFVCGPPGMMDDAVGRLLEAGMIADRIVTERFDYDAAKDPLSVVVRRRFLAVLGAVLGAVLVAAAFA